MEKMSTKNTISTGFVANKALKSIFVSALCFIIVNKHFEKVIVINYKLLFEKSNSNCNPLLFWPSNSNSNPLLFKSNV